MKNGFFRIDEVVPLNQGDVKVPVEHGLLFHL